MENPKYYVVGNFTDWAVDEAYELTKNEAAEVEEYMLKDLELDATAQFKVVKVESGKDNVWYPDGMDNNYQVTAAGTYTVYFRPNGDGEVSIVDSTIIQRFLADLQIKYPVDQYVDK